MDKEKSKRNGRVLVGAYIPKEVKTAIVRRAAARHTTISQIVLEMIEESLKQGTQKK
jgi:hypothetical protein